MDFTYGPDTHPGWCKRPPGPDWAVPSETARRNQTGAACWGHTAPQRRPVGGEGGRKSIRVLNISCYYNKKSARAVPAYRGRGIWSALYLQKGEGKGQMYFGDNDFRPTLFTFIQEILIETLHTYQAQQRYSHKWNRPKAQTFLTQWSGTDSKQNLHVS